MSLRVVCVAASFACLLSACAGRVPSEGGTFVSAFAAHPAMKPSTATDADTPVPLTPAAWGRVANPSSLAGRTIDVSSLEDIALRDKEVVLTFDDGPMPKKTERILATLDEFGVKATFLMVGEMAQAYPQIAREVVSHGHTIGSHTYHHANLRNLSFDEAMAEINKGRKAVSTATREDVGFFRFPYLSDTRRLRRSVASEGMVVLDVQVDSKDYFSESPAAVATRTMHALSAHRRGIILLHDIHVRTAAMLPALLTQMRAEGYKVVTLRRKAPSLLMASVQTATAGESH
ncbi:polysaccharide deacetylase family protein [Rhizobium sp. SAFR-030]|uniref:polysaccharide deacetylase family protein n=1 Tax=Rhizobium sp. SAFR-030 TaxID=3387277 RepID=UPI003F7D7271